MDSKTNAMRLLDKREAIYTTHSYAQTAALSGADVARVLGQDPRRVFKTLVTLARSKKHYVFVIPVEAELDLKKAALSVGEKAIDMLKMKELFPLTGYVHGGCSPIGMKKFFPTVLDLSAAGHETIFFSAGKIGFQLEMRLPELEKAIAFRLAPLTQD